MFSPTQSSSNPHQRRMIVSRMITRYVSVIFQLIFCQKVVTILVRHIFIKCFDTKMELLLFSGSLGWYVRILRMSIQFRDFLVASMHSNMEHPERLTKPIEIIRNSIQFLRSHIFARFPNAINMNLT